VNRHLLILLSIVLATSLASQAQERRAYRQPSVPEGWVERPFVETAPAPKLTPAEQRRGYLVFHRPITEPVYRNTHPRSYERADRISIFATPGEFEPATISVYPVRDLEDFSVRCSDLVSESGRIPSSSIDVRLVTYWNIRYPRYASEGTYRRIPELLERVTVHSSPRFECQRWWLTVHVPPSASAGSYLGTVTLRDAHSEPLVIPMRLHVWGFTLRRDPNKHLSAYYYPRNRWMFADRDESFMDRATANEYQSMADHGLDMLPTFYLRLDRETGRIVVDAAEEIDRMLARGFSGPLPVLGGNVIAVVYRETTPGGRRGSHWQINKLPPPEFYSRLTELFRRFKQDAAARGWPELICCPLDEVAASSKKFGAKVYAAVKAAGIRTYATKNPKAPDAVAYGDAVDVWCSQPFARSYEYVVADKQHEYWSYPNHNAGERKNRVIACKGGRMTYGFGFWRSGYRVLIPWHWAWTMAPDPMDYLRTRRSGCGQRIDESGEVIPAIYWECFREGFDDGRYVYTLQQAIWEREPSDDPACQAVVREAKRRLQETWDAIEVQERYLQDHLWPSSEFDARRWELATCIDRLLKFPALRQGTAPSVLVDPGPSTGRTADEANRVAEGSTIESLDLGEDFTEWRAETPEAAIEVVKPRAATSPVLRWKIAVDHLAGGRADGKYNVGWPRVRRAFPRGKVDVTRYDFLEVIVRVESDRDEVEDDVTMLGISFSSHEERRLYELQRDLGDRQGEAIRLLFPIAELMRASGKGEAPWKSLAYLQFFISEANYSHGTHLQFDISRVRLLRFRHPAITDIGLPRVMLSPRRYLPVSFELMGKPNIRPGSHRVVIAVFGSYREPMTRVECDPASANIAVLDVSKLTPGEYRIETAIGNGAMRHAGPSGTLRVVAGPAGSDKR